ncbi:Uncharacterised protein [Chlamydia abortus]|nr:Uncharacterised protein [Chlamydia abortus]
MRLPAKRSTVLTPKLFKATKTTAELYFVSSFLNSSSVIAPLRVSKLKHPAKRPHKNEPKPPQPPAPSVHPQPTQPQFPEQESAQPS